MFTGAVLRSAVLELALTGAVSAASCGPPVAAGGQRGAVVVSTRRYATWDPKVFGLTTTAHPDGYNMADMVTPENPGKRWGMYEKPVDYSERIQHQTLVALDGEKVAPVVSEAAFVEPSATVVGNVELWDYASVGCGSVLRGDVTMVRVGMYSSIGRDCVVDEALEPLGADHDGSTMIGHNVLVGDRCHIRAATLHDNCGLGDGCVLLDGSVVKQNSFLLPGSVLQPFTTVPADQVWGGNPARFVREASEEDVESLIAGPCRQREASARDRISEIWYGPVHRLWQKVFPPDSTIVAEAIAKNKK